MQSRLERWVSASQSNTMTSRPLYSNLC